MSNRPIGWTSNDDPAGYRFPKPVKATDEAVRRYLARDEVVQCGWELKRIERPKPREADPAQDERMREAARLVNDPATRGNYYRKIIAEKSDLERGKIPATEDEDLRGFLLRKFGVENYRRGDK